MFLSNAKSIPLKCLPSTAGNLKPHLSTESEKEMLEAIGQFAKDTIPQVQQNLAVTNTDDEGRVPLVEKEHPAVAPND